MKFSHCALCLCVLAILPNLASAQSTLEAGNHAHSAPMTSAVTYTQSANPLRDAGVAQADRVVALAAKAKSASVSIAAATLSEIEACDACLARNDLATILAAQPAADLKSLAPTLVSKTQDESKSRGSNADRKSVV